jgi:hypothetical protein
MTALSRVPRSLAAAEVGLDHHLARLEQSHGIPPSEVQAILFPEGRSPLRVLAEVRDFPIMEALSHVYKEAVAVATTLDDGGDERLLALEGLRRVRRMRRALEVKASAAKLGAGQKWQGFDGPAWHMTPAELAAAGRGNVRQWGYLTDRVVALAAYLAPRMRGERQRQRGRIKPEDARPYKQIVLRTTAELVNAAFGLYFPALRKQPLTAGDVKARVQRRGARR